MLTCPVIHLKYLESTVAMIFDEKFVTILPVWTNTLETTGTRFSHLYHSTPLSDTFIFNLFNFPSPVPHSSSSGKRCVYRFSRLQCKLHSWYRLLNSHSINDSFCLYYSTLNSNCMCTVVSNVSLNNICNCDTVTVAGKKHKQIPTYHTENWPMQSKEKI